MKTYRKVRYKNVPYYKNVTAKQWNDWRWQLRHAIRDAATLRRVIELSDEEQEGVTRCLGRFRMAITPYYACLMDPSYRLDSVRLQAVPTARELEGVPDDLADPLHEEQDSATPGLTHRYPDRVLFLITKVCSMYCRHCTRRRMVGDEDCPMPRSNLEKAYAYVRAHREIRDVLLSGGDPLTLPDRGLEPILRALRSIEHVEIIRIGSRMPVVCPQRITPGLVRMLRKYEPLYVNTHFNHYQEVTAESKAACGRLVDAGIPVGNQSVLLRDVNDCPRIMKKLMHELLMIRVKPYYIYQCDMTAGIAHFRTSIAKGMEIMENLRGHTTGMAVPTFVVDAPGGGGKIPVMPNYVISQSDKRVVLRNYEGLSTAYAQPENIYSDCWCELCTEHRYGPLDGVAKLLLGEKQYLEPEGLVRIQRKQNDTQTSRGTRED